MDLNLWCKSNFICAEFDVELPENDETKWVTLQFAFNNLHESQKNFLNKVKNILGSDIIK